MSTFAITPSLGVAHVSAMADAIIRRDAILAETIAITSVTDRFDSDCAADTVKQAKEFIKSIEAAHSEAKAPVLELGRKIDATKKELINQIESEASRIGRLVGAFEDGERRKADEARRKAENEAAAIRRKADEEALTAMRTAKTDEEALRKQDDILHAAEAKVAEVRSEVVAAPKLAAGLKLRKELTFEVQDIHALYKDNPTLVKLEPNKAAIKAILTANPNLKIEGITYSWASVV